MSSRGLWKLHPTASTAARQASISILNVCRLGAGSKTGRDVILRLLRERKLQVPTSVLGAEGGYGSVDHIAVPEDWKVMSVERHVAAVGGRRLSDHDAYVVEI